MRKTTLLMLSLMVYGCYSCQEGQKKPYEGRLDKNYELVIAHVAPDEDREFPIEVFVGRLLTIFPDSTDAANLQDYMMQIQLRAFVDEYQALLKYHDDAEVFITAGKQTVQLQNVGKGTYRDVSNVLQVSALEVCSLRVTRANGHEYFGMVTVPDNITITNPLPGDTVTEYPKKDTPESSFCVSLTHTSGPKVDGSYYYRFRTPYLYATEQPDIINLMSENDGGLAILIDECGEINYMNINWTSMALDTALTRAWGARETTGIEPAVWDSLRQWLYFAPITYRSNITDENGEKIAGYFGAYNSIKTNFVVKALRDSCVCD